jgi:hypothetical protein
MNRSRSRRGPQSIMRLIAVAAMPIVVLVGATSASAQPAQPTRPMEAPSIGRGANPGELLKVLEAAMSRAAARGERVWTSGKVFWRSPEMADAKASYKLFRKYAKPYCDSWRNAYVRAYGPWLAVPFWTRDWRRAPLSDAGGAYSICSTALYTPILPG